MKRTHQIESFKSQTNTSYLFFNSTMRTIGSRLFRLFSVAIVVTAITFLLINLLPGDVAYLVGGEQATVEDIRAIRQDLRLDRNIVVRYFSWLGRIAVGDLGKSFLTQEPVLNAIVSRLPVTLELLVFSQFFALLLALPAAIFSAYRNGEIQDRLINACGFATLSMPSFVMALLSIYLFSIELGWLPATGYTPFVKAPWANVKSFILPSLSIALIEWVVLMRVLRSDMITTLQQNYILMARAKGLPPWRVLLRHALKPSSFTLITIIGIQIGRLLGEAVIVESIFALPGIGRLLINAIYNRDYFMVQGCVLFITIGYVTVNSLVDIMYTILDPRVRTKVTYGS